MNKYCFSCHPMFVFEWCRMADGIKIVDLGGKSMTSFRSQSTRCPGSEVKCGGGKYAMGPVQHEGHIMEQEVA